MQVVFSQAAKQDLLDIWVYIASQSSQTIADRIYDHISQTCSLLSEYPELGRERPEIADLARSIVVERWLILYQLSDNRVQIVRILDGSRDIKNIWG